MVLTTQQSALTQKPRQNTNYLQLGGMINRLHAVMTIFLNGSVCAVQNLIGVRRLSISPGYTPGNSGWLPYGFVLILLLQVRWIAHAGHEKTNLTWLAKSATNSKMRSLLWLDQGLQTTAREKFCHWWKNIFTKICWFGRIWHTPKQSQYIRRQALDMFCTTSPGPRTKSLETLG